MSGFRGHSVALAKSRARHRRLGIAHPVLIDGERFLDAFWPQPMPERFEDLAIPHSVVATDFRRRREAVFTTGPLRPAAAGSMAIPGLVRAAPSPQGFIVDGGLVNPLLYDLLAGKADIVIAVDLSRVSSNGDDEKAAPKPLETHRRQPDHDERDQPSHDRRKNRPTCWWRRMSHIILRSICSRPGASSRMATPAAPG